MVTDKSVKIDNGKDKLYQWDTGRWLIVEDDRYNEVHFSSDSRDAAYVCPVEVKDGVRIVNIPNFLLHDNDLIHAYFCYVDENRCMTLHHQTFHVQDRQKPESYIYTETEVLNYSSIFERVRKLEESQLGVNCVKSIILQHAKENPVTAESIGALTENSLKEAVDNVLLQAKESGVFNGEKGDTGATGSHGPQGEKGDTGATGPQGTDGYTPVKGLDYWTDADQESIVQQVITALGTPVFGRVDADNNIILTGELADGTYTLKYEDADGNVTEIGTLEQGGVSYTNQIPISIDSDGNVYNGTGYKIKSRLGSRGTVSDIADASATNPVFVTGFIPVKRGDIIRMKNCYIDTDGISSDTSVEAAYYGNAVSAIRCGIYRKDDYSMAYLIAWNAFTTWDILASVATTDSNGYVTEFTIGGDVSGLIRLTLGGDPKTAILTVNEEITD